MADPVPAQERMANERLAALLANACYDVRAALEVASEIRRARAAEAALRARLAAWEPVVKAAVASDLGGGHGGAGALAPASGLCSGGRAPASWRTARSNGTQFPLRFTWSDAILLSCGPEGGAEEAT